jgi:transposase
MNWIRTVSTMPGRIFHQEAIGQRRYASVRISDRARNLVERFFSKIKHCRHVTTRYDKLGANYSRSFKLASIRLWLRINVSTSY